MKFYKLSDVNVSIASRYAIFLPNLVFPDMICINQSGNTYTLCEIKKAVSTAFLYEVGL